MRRGCKTWTNNFTQFVALTRRSFATTDRANRGENGRQASNPIVREDPFHARGLAEFRIIEFRASQRAKDIQARIDGDDLASS